MGPLIPKNNEKARFAQVYVMETEDQLRAWHGLAFAQSLREPLLIGLGNMLQEHNAYAKIFRQAAPLHNPDVTIMLRCASNVDPRTYNVFRVSQVAAFIPADTNVNASRQLQTGGIKRITDLNSDYDALHYVLLFPRGEQGWTTDIQLRKEHRPVQGAPVEEDQGTPMTKKAHGTVSARAFAALYLMQRPVGYIGNFV